MNHRIIAALMAKDLVLFFRNRFFAVVTVLGLVAYVVIYLVLPDRVDEQLTLAIYAPALPPVFEVMQEEGLVFDTYDSEASLRQVVADGDYPAGIALGNDALARLAAGERAQIQIYLNATAPPEIQDAVPLVVEELFLMQSGQPLPLEVETEILGQDRVGFQIPPRDRMVPLFAVFLMITEMLGLSSLIAEEVVGRTLQALLITPMTVGGIFAAKGIIGVGLAAGQAALFLLLTAGLSQQPLLVLAALFLGAVMVTGIGFLLASVGRDLLSIMSWGIPLIIVLMVPAFAVIFPGGVSDWVRLIPSYYLVDTVHQAINLDVGWSELWSNLVVLLVFDAAVVWLGMTALRRRIL